MSRSGTVGKISEMVVRMPSQMVGRYDADELSAEWVQAVTAFVSVAPGAEVTETELQQIMRDKLALRDPLWTENDS